MATEANLRQLMGSLKTTTLSWFDDGCCDVKYLDIWQDRPVSYASRQIHYTEKHHEQFEINIGRDQYGALFQRAADWLMRYRLYPQDKLSCLGDFDLGRSRRLMAGDRVVHRLHLVRLFGKPVLDLVGMIEIGQTVEEPRCYGFRCVSVTNHVGSGEMSANLSWTDSNDVVLTIDTTSCPRPGELLRQYHWMRGLYRQVYQAALGNFKRTVLGV